MIGGFVERRWPRAVWRLAGAAWALVAVIRALHRLDGMAAGRQVAPTQAWTEGLLWLLPLALLTLAGIGFPELVGPRGTPPRRFGAWFLPLAALLAAVFAWAQVIFVAGLTALPKGPG